MSRRKGKNTPKRRKNRPSNSEMKEEIGKLLDLKDFRQSVPRSHLALALLICAIYHVSLSAALGIGNLEASDQTYRNALKFSLPVDRAALLATAIPFLFERLPNRIKKRLRRKGGLYVAVDYHQRPFYGDRDCPYIVGGKEKDSTNWSWTYATLCFVEPGYRLTLACTYVSSEDTPDTVLDRLLNQIQSYGIHIRCLLLDSGFYSARVVNLLQKKDIDFIIPVIKRGKKGKGTSPFFEPGTHMFTTYEWKGRKKTDPTVNVVIASLLDPSKATKKKKKQLVYACSRRMGNLQQVVDLYRKRFGIETSYRQLGECLGRTTSKDPVWRLALILISIALRNLWVLCQLDDEYLPLRVMVANICTDWLIELREQSKACNGSGSSCPEPQLC